MAEISEMGKDQIVKGLSSLRPLVLNSEYECWPQVTTTHPKVGTKAFTYSVRMFTGGTSGATEVTSSQFSTTYHDLGDIEGNPWEAVADLILIWRTTVSVQQEITVTENED